MMDTDTDTDIDTDTDTDTDNNREDESTLSGSYSKPYLDPEAIFTLSTSVPNCSRVTPPKDKRPLAPSRLSVAVHHHLTAGCTMSDSTLS